MVRAALTGGIATGKSHCLERFVQLGAAVVDADRLSREVVAPGTPGSPRHHPVRGGVVLPMAA